MQKQEDRMEIMNEFVRFLIEFW